MSEPYIFPVYDVYAEVRRDGGLRLRFVYPNKKTATAKRMPPNPEFGIHVMKQLIKEPYAEIANKQYPNRPPSGGSIYILEDGTFFSPRRSIDAPTNKLHHSLQTGFPKDEWQTVHLEECIKEEGCELVLTTKDKDPWLIVSKNDPFLRKIQIESASHIGIDTNKLIETEFEYASGKDVVEIIDGDAENHIDGYFAFLWCEEKGSTLIKPCYIKFDPENIVPHDVEGRYIDGKFYRFGRETFVFHPDVLKNKKFGDKLDNPVVYITKIRNGKAFAELQKEEPKGGPYIFMPDQDLRRMLFRLGIWEGNWIEYEIEYNKRFLQEGNK